MKRAAVLLSGLLMTSLCGTVGAQGVSVALADLGTRLKGELLDLGMPGQENPRIRYQAGDGAVRSLKAPIGRHYEHTMPSGSTVPREIAVDFLNTWWDLFGIASADTDFTVKRELKINGRTHVRLDQTYRGLPVYAAQAIVAVDANGGITKAHSTLMRNTASLDASVSTTVASLSQELAMAYAEAGLTVILSTDPTFPDGWIAREGLVARAVPAPELLIYDPSVLSRSSVAPPVLVWKVRVTDNFQGRVIENVYVNANNGDVIEHNTLIISVKERHIFDAGCRKWDDTNVPDEAGLKVISEGDPGGTLGTSCCAGVPADACELYQNMGLIFDLFNDVIVSGMTGGLEGWDPDTLADDDLTKGWINLDGLGFSPCTYNWAGSIGDYGYPPRILFGPDMTRKDVVAHEWTHNVVSFEYLHANYADYSNRGALSESLADIFGEFMDLLNEDLTLAEDSPNGTSTTYRWKIGEGSPLGVFRNMAVPDSIIGHSSYVGDNNWINNGANHKMAGPSNKTAHLLVEGGTFRGLSFTEFDSDRSTSIKAVANLIYQVIQQDMLAAHTYDDYSDFLSAMASDFAANDANPAVGTYGGPGPGSDGLWISIEVNTVDDVIQATGLIYFPIVE